MKALKKSFSQKEEPNQPETYSDNPQNEEDEAEAVQEPAQPEPPAPTNTSQETNPQSPPQQFENKEFNEATPKSEEDEAEAVQEPAQPEPPSPTNPSQETEPRMQGYESNTETNNTEQNPSLEEKPLEKNTTKLVDKDASFEIPDFTEEDLDFDLGLDEFVPEEQKEEPPEETPPEYEKELPSFEIKKTEEKEDEDDEELPGFDLEKKEEEEVKEKITENEIPEDVKSIFVESTNYIKICALKNDLKAKSQKDKSLTEEIHESHDWEMNTLNKANDALEDMKQSLLYVDRKLFDKGDMNE